MASSSIFMVAVWGGGFPLAKLMNNERISRNVATEQRRNEFPL